MIGAGACGQKGGPKPNRTALSLFLETHIQKLIQITD